MKQMCLSKTSSKMKLQCTLTCWILTLSLMGVLVSAAPAEQMCSSSICKQSAKYIADGLNTSADPCTDFYQFACGGWEEKHSIPDSKARIGTFDALNEKMRDELKELLENYHLKENKVGTSSVSMSYASYVYQKCIQLGKESSAEGMKQLKEVVESIFDRTWIIGQQLKMKDLSWQENFALAYAKGSMSPIFSIGITPDSKNVTKNILSIFPGGLGLGDKELKNLTLNSALVNAYKDYIRKAGKLFCGEICTGLENDITDMLNLESELAKVKMSLEDQRNPDKTYNKMTIKELNEKTNFNWLTEIFQPTLRLMNLAEVGAALTDSETIRISDVGYVVKAIEILKRTSSRTVANLMGWRAVATNGPRSSEQFRNYTFEFSQVSSGVKKQSERWEMCYGQANGHLSMAVSRLFVDKYLSPGEKAEAVALVESIQQSYRELIIENTWLDPVTRANSLIKLNHVTKNVAYPDWLLKDEELDKLYSLGNKSFAGELLKEKNYIASLLKFNLNRDREEIGEFDKPNTIEKRWPMPPAIINAAYSGNQNSITIPGGILKFPFFSAERPFSINYGFIGVVIGHEFAHGLDDKGRKFDEIGNLHNWWTNEAVQRFHNRSDCFVQQYGSQVEPLTGLNLNGRNTLGENIADNGGLHESYNAFQTRQKLTGASPRLADLPQYSPEQLFFISYANTWCQRIRPEALKRQIEYDPHAPGQYRVNIPLSNSEYFAKAFHCDPGTKMNPPKKCQLW